MNVLYVVLLCASVALTQVLTGGTRLLFALPGDGLLAVAALCSLADLRRAKLPPNQWCLISSGLFFGYILVRAAFSPVAYLAWTDSFMVIGALTVYLLTACYLTDPRRRLWVLAGLLVLVGCNLVIGGRQFAGDNKTTVFGFLRAAQYGNRASGFYICPDHLAGFLEMMTCLSLSMAVWSRTRAWLKILFGYAAFCCLAALLLTGSRGGYLSMIVGLVVLVVLGLQQVRVTSPEWFARAATAVLVLSLGLALGVAFTVSHVRSLGDRADHLVDTGDIRLRIWPAAIREFQENPAFGTGASTFLYYGRKFRDPVVQSDPMRAHNDYLELLGEYGLAGVLGLLLFLTAHLGWGWQTFRRLCRRSAGQGSGGGSNSLAWNIGALASVACLLAHSAVDFNLHIPVNCLVLAFVFGVLANPGRALDERGDQVARFHTADLVPRLALPALAVVVVVWGLPKLPGEYDAEQARVALRDHHNAAALDFARRGVEKERGNPYLFGYLGTARLNLGGTGPDTLIARSFREDAAQAFAQAVHLAPSDSDLLGRLGEAQARLNDFTGAEETFRQALLWDPNSSWVLTYEGFYLQQRGRYAEAGEAFKRAAALGGNTVAASNLAQIAQQGIVPQAAIDPTKQDAQPERAGGNYP